ncbi:MAG: ribonuclease P protein component [Eubacteriales bacterium]
MKLTAVKENHLYSKAYAKGKKYVGRTVVVYIMRDTHAGLLKKRNPLKIAVNRVGLTVTKKIGGAVVRNRCKRIIREAYRLTDRESRIRRGFIIIIVARDSAVTAKMQQVKTDITAAMKRLEMTSAPLPDKHRL